MDSLNPKVNLINASNRSTGIGRYSINVHKTLGSYSKLFSFAFSKEDYDNGMPGEVVKGFYPSRLSSGWVINTTLQRLVYNKIRRGIQKDSLDSVITHYVDPYIYPFTVRNKSVVTIHDLFAFDKRLWAPSSWKKYARRALLKFKDYSWVITDSVKVKNELDSFGFTGEITPIHICVDTDLFRSGDKEASRRELGLPLDKILLLSVSSKSRRKNLDILKKVKEILGDRYSLVRVGSDVGQDFQFSNISDIILNKIYTACDVLVFPTIDEGFGLPTLEAMAVGLPVVASDIEVMHEIGKDTFIYSEQSPTHFSEAVKIATSQADKLSRGGIVRAKKEFSIVKFRKDLVDVYRRISNE